MYRRADSPLEVHRLSFEVLRNASEHPARSAALHSMDCVQRKDREGWLSMWDDDAVIEDPVGPSPLDPDGNGHRGIEKITAFWDNVINPVEMRFQIRQTFACGSECANVGTITVKMPGGIVSRTELVIVYRVNEDGKVLSLRAFWEFDQTAKEVF
jgi:steroid delta-isomerase